MEENRDIFDKQVISMNKSKVGKPPTRLQKQAPTSLRLDQIKTAASADRTSPLEPSSFSSCSEAATPIPLLTPLALSPRLLTKTNDFMFPTVDIKPATPAPTPLGWKQQAAAGAGVYVEAPLFALFQSKCVVVNDAQ